MKEYQLQKAVCKYLNAKGVLYCGSMGGQYQAFRSQRIKAKQTGYKKGFPDLFIYEPRGNFHGLAIDLKVGYNNPTAEQQMWLKKLKIRGYYAESCNGIDEAIGLINKYLKL